MAALMIEANDDELQVIAMVFGIFCCLISWALCVWTTNYGEIIVKTNERKRWHWTQLLRRDPHNKTLVGLHVGLTVARV